MKGDNLMEYTFICKKCGNMQDAEWDKDTYRLKCNNCNDCNEKISWANAFPTQSVIEFYHSVNSLYDLSKERDKENLTNMCELLEQDGIKIDKTLLDKYRNQYEEILEKNRYNDDTLWLEIDDTFLEVLEKQMNYKSAIAISSALKLCKTNEFRKAYIIMVASLIEQLFQDYFIELVGLHLSPYGKKNFLRKYETAGIQAVIDISQSFLDEDLCRKMNRYSNGFFF